MSVKSKQSISNLPGQVRDEDAARMAGGVRTAAEPDVKGIIIPVDDGAQGGKVGGPPKHVNLEAGEGGKAGASPVVENGKAADKADARSSGKSASHENSGLPTPRPLDGLAKTMNHLAGKTDVQEHGNPARADNKVGLGEKPSLPIPRPLDGLAKTMNYLAGKTEAPDHGNPARADSKAGSGEKPDAMRPLPLDGLAKTMNHLAGKTEVPDHGNPARADTKVGSGEKPGTAKPLPAASFEPAAGGDGKKTLSGEIGREFGQLPGAMFREAGNATLDYAITKAIKEAEDAGKVRKTGTFEISDDDRRKPVKTRQGGTEISTTEGPYSAGFAGAMTYGYSGDVKVGGAVAAAGFEKGWVSKTVTKQDRFGAQVTVTERWTEGVLTVGARADAHDTKGGAKISAQFKAEAIGEDGIRVSITDKATGITYSKMGVLRAEASAQGEGRVSVTWERMGIKLAGSVGVEASATRAASMTSESGAGFGISGTGKLKAGGLASLDDGVSWNPIDGYTFATKHRAELNFGAVLGLSPSLSTAVSTLVVGADAVFGKVGAHADVTMGVKDGKFSFGVDIGGALGIGYNLKFNTQIDFAKWSDNVNRHMQTPGNYGYPGQEFRYTNPGEAVAVWLKTMFDSKPEPPAGKPPLAPTANATEAATYYHEMLTKLSKVEELRKLVRDAEHSTLRISAQDRTLVGEAEGKVLGEKIKKENAFFKDERSPTGYKDPTLYESFPSVGEISKAMQRWFPESKLPELKAMELTFSNKLPAGFERDFKFVKDANGKSVPSTEGAFAIFAGLSLTQYLSINEYSLVSRMERGELEQYLGKKGDGFEKTARSDHLTDAAKQKLLDSWELAFERGTLGNPYDKQGREVSTPMQPNAHGVNIKDDRFEAKFWELSRSPADSKSKQMQFEDQVREFNKYYYQTTKAAAVVDQEQSRQANVTAMKVIEVPSGSVPIKDKTLGPQNFWTNQTAVNFQGVPRDADKWHLIDLTPAKEGKIGLNDLIYKHTIERLDACRSPQAAYQFLKASDWIAEDGMSRGELVSLWTAKHLHGEWSTASDADAQRARAWYDKHKQEFYDLR